MFLSRGVEGASAVPVALRTASSLPPHAGRRDFRNRDGDLLASAGIKDGEGHGSFLRWIPISCGTACISVTCTTRGAIWLTAARQQAFYCRSQESEQGFRFWSAVAVEIDRRAGASAKRTDEQSR
jgi:hypothetical protein